MLILGAFNLRERGKFGALSHPQEAGHQDSSHNTHMHSLNKHALTVTDVNYADHKHALNGKKGGCMLFLETDPGWSLETQMLLITTCHNSDFGFKSCVSLHLSPWSRVIASSRLQSAASLSWPVWGRVWGHAVLAASSRRAGRSLVLLVIVLFRKAAEGLFACSVAQERSNGWVCVSCLMLLYLLFLNPGNIASVVGLTVYSFIYNN